MNNTSKILAAGLLAVAALGGTAFADNENSAFAQSVREHTYGNAPSQSDSYGYSFHKGFIARAAEGRGVTVRHVGALPDAESAMISSHADADPAAIQALQGSISQDAGLVRALAAQQVKVSDIISVSTGFDGSKLYIAR